MHGPQEGLRSLSNLQTVLILFGFLLCLDIETDDTSHATRGSKNVYYMIKLSGENKAGLPSWLKYDLESWERELA